MILFAEPGLLARRTPSLSVLSAMAPSCLPVISHSPLELRALQVLLWCSRVADKRSEAYIKSSRNRELCECYVKHREEICSSCFSAPEVDAKTMDRVGSELLFAKLIPLRLLQGINQGQHHPCHHGLMSASCGGDLGLPDPLRLGPAPDSLSSLAASMWLMASQPLVSFGTHSPLSSMCQAEL